MKLHRLLLLVSVAVGVSCRDLGRVGEGSGDVNEMPPETEKIPQEVENAPKLEEDEEEDDDMAEFGDGMVKGRNLGIRIRLALLTASSHHVA